MRCAPKIRLHLIRCIFCIIRSTAINPSCVDKPHPQGKPDTTQRTHFCKLECLTEIGELELALLADEEVLRLDVAVEDPPAVAVGEAAQQLEEEEPHVAPGQPAGVLLQVLRQVRVLEEPSHATQLSSWLCNISKC